MEASQLVEHALSLIFGGAGGIAAGLAKLKATLSSIDKRQSSSEKRLETLERRVESLLAQRREQGRVLEDLKEAQSRLASDLHRQFDRQMEDLKKQVVAQNELSHSMVGDKIDELRVDMGAMRSTMLDQQSDLQRSLGSVEGTLKMISRNGCARACSSDRASIPDTFPSEPPTRGRSR